MDAAERDTLVAAIVERVADYRNGEIDPISRDHVIAWWGQFEANDRPTILRETARILRCTYLPRQKFVDFMSELAVRPALTGSDPAAFWRSVGFLRIQYRGTSQLDMLALMDQALVAQFNMDTSAQQSTQNVYVYLDDVCFSGDRVSRDISKWVEENNVRDATIYVLCMVTYTGGEYNANRKMQQVRDRGCRVRFISKYTLENRRAHAREGAVFWPTVIPANDEHVDKWRAELQQPEQFYPRPIGGQISSTLFSSEESRHVIEQAFLRKGAYIYGLSQTPDVPMRPLGYSWLRIPGFGATIATYRNCPNNAPLVLWWGDPNGLAPLNRWRPLLPRKF